MKASNPLQTAFSLSAIILQKSFIFQALVEREQDVMEMTPFISSVSAEQGNDDI